MTPRALAVRIQSSGGLSDSDIERMVQEAEQFASADQERKAQVETRRIELNWVIRLSRGHAP